MDRHDENITVRKIMEMYLSYDFPEEIEQEVKEWLVGNSHASEKEEVLWDVWNGIRAAREPGQDRALRSIKTNLGITARPSLRRRLTRIAAAAAVAGLLIASTVWMIMRQDVEQAPGVALNIIKTGEGEKRYTELEDGTSMWLNAESEASFTDGRDIILAGEGFFEVSHIGGETFSVSSGEIKAVVTGTTFNFRSYETEQSAVISLYEGSLTVESPDTVVYLVAGQEFEFRHTDSTVTVTDIYRIQPEWLRDVINFGDLTVGEVFRMLEKIYGVRIDTAGISALGDRLELKFEGGLSLDEVLYFMSEISGKFRYRIEPDRVYIWDDTDKGVI